MARYNEILVGRYNRLIQKLFSIKGPASLISTDDSISPVLPIFHGRELDPLQGWNKYVMAAKGPAVGAQTGGLRFRNPAGKGIIVVIEKLSYSQDNLASGVPTGWTIVEYGFPNGGTLSIVDLATILLTPTALDYRGSGKLTIRPLPVLVVSFGSTPSQEATDTQFAAFVNGVAGGAVLFPQPLDLITFEDQELVLPPGMGIQIRTQSINTNMLAILQWRERPLEDSELL
jgi:hypothetical protein